MSNPTDEAVLRSKWRFRLAEVEAACEQKPTQENHAEWERVLKIFSDLVIEGKEPPPDAALVECPGGRAEPRASADRQESRRGTVEGRETGAEGGLMPKAPECHQAKLTHRSCAKCGHYPQIVHMPVAHVGYYCPACCPTCAPAGSDGAGKRHTRELE